MYANMEEFGRAMEGEFGPEEQAEAERFAQESGLIANWEREAAEQEGDQFEQSMESQFQHLEERLHRKLTSGEEEQMLRAAERSGEVPDLVATYGDQLDDGGLGDNAHLRAAEAAHAAMAEQGQSLEPPPLPNLTYPGQQGEE